MPPADAVIVIKQEQDLLRFECATGTGTRNHIVSLREYTIKLPKRCAC